MREDINELRTGRAQATCEREGKKIKLAVLES